MINYGTKAQIELGPIKEDDTYLDIINIYRYDMIIGTPFMRKHKFVLNFGHNAFSMYGQVIHPMTSGQEDLMIIWKWRSQSQPGMPLTHERSMACKSDWLRPNAAVLSHMTSMRSPGYNNFLLEGRGMKHVQYMDTTKINKDINGGQKLLSDQWEELPSPWIHKDY